jgi:integrase
MGNITQRDLPNVIARAATLHPLRPIHFHDLRHLTPTYCAQAGVGPKEIQHLLGHRDPEVALRVYTHDVSGSLGDVLNQLVDQWLGPKSHEP